MLRCGHSGGSGPDRSPCRSPERSPCRSPCRSPLPRQRVAGTSQRPRTSAFGPPGRAITRPRPAQRQTRAHGRAERVPDLLAPTPREFRCGVEAGSKPRRSRWFFDSNAADQSPRIRLSASSTACNSPGSSRPADRPSRCGSTTVVCSTRTRVSRRSTTIIGRKVACRALVDVGATSVVLRSRNSSAWTMTAKRAPRCSCPRAPRGDGKRKISPRTISQSGEARARPSARTTSSAAAAASSSRTCSERVIAEL